MKHLLNSLISLLILSSFSLLGTQVHPEKRVPYPIVREGQTFSLPQFPEIFLEVFSDEDNPIGFILDDLQEEC